MVENDTMIYRNLGSSGLKVSALSFGNGLINYSAEVEENLYQIFQKSISAGINFFDTAEKYGAGEGERFLGNIIKRGDWDRDNLVISTKFIRCGRSIGLSRKRLIQGMRNSLKRLQLQYVDVMYLHRFDDEVPLLETIRAVNHLIEKGKADYWGTSEFTAFQIQECHKICEKYGFIHPVVDQCQYNLMIRDKAEVEFSPLFDKYGMGVVAWSPLMGGFLSGKYNSMNIPEGSRLGDPHLPQVAKQPYEPFFLPENQEKTRKMLCGLEEIAREIGCSQSQLALAWCMKNNDVSSTIFGATKVSQAEDNLGAIGALSKLTPEILARIEEIVSTRPVTAINWRTWQPMPSRR